ncbi:hypothetical protein CISG_01875 [Coccidioides immitis RMSCC 3703]|uniref:Aminoglycoside phosphotransferase domain-containing protein n=2 Tax=Coccidioides immitis TaxID=5501 RepID=A0A0J8R389_COCIT|nr:hypothetical protein CIRG_08518 [Coccidioides immitis RMSCC 2394]KMU78835.1 hypothetical protein CISG_01875 [Coccidioides immitis RMSCC 3703]
MAVDFENRNRKMVIKEVNFLDSSFFATKAGQKRGLPTPIEVIALSKDFKTDPPPAPVKFDHLNLLVKFGSAVEIEEALCLRMIRKTFCDKIPVPEVYGWKVHNGCVFIYMELIRGDTLHDRWDSLSEAEKASICDQLQVIVSSLRQVEQDPKDPFIGSIARQHLHDYVFETMPWKGPFKNERKFNDWFSSLPQHWLPESRKYRDPYRDYLPDNGTIKLTHGDLHHGNILISPTRPPRIIALIDWAHAGGYPEYWEYCKALYTSHYEGEWRNVWIPKFLDPYETEGTIFGGICIADGSNMSCSD